MFMSGLLVVLLILVVVDLLLVVVVEGNNVDGNTNGSLFLLLLLLLLVELGVLVEFLPFVVVLVVVAEVDDRNDLINTGVFGNALVVVFVVVVGMFILILDGILLLLLAPLTLGNRNVGTGGCG